MADESRNDLIGRMVELKRSLVEIQQKLGIPPSVVVPTLSEGTDTAAYELLSKYSTDLLSIHAGDGDYLWVSPNSASFFGWEPGELVGVSAYALFHPRDAERVARDHARHPKGDEGSVIYRIRRKDGKYRWVHTRSISRRDADGVHQIISITRDIHSTYMATRRARRAERELKAQLMVMARTDSLTGAANRFSGTEILEREVNRCGRSNVDVSIVLFDLDHFKEVNDRFGHQSGDQVLKRVVDAVKTDIRPYDTLVRWGGEEFLIIMPDTPLSRAADVAERLRVLVSTIDFADFTVTASFGVTSCSHAEAATPDSIVARADKALYRAKGEGRDRVVVDAPPVSRGTGRRGVADHY